MDSGRTLVALSQEHHGVFLAARSGLSRGELRTAQRRGWIAPVLPGVMRTTAAPEGLVATAADLAAPAQLVDRIHRAFATRAA